MDQRDIGKYAQTSSFMFGLACPMEADKRKDTLQDGLAGPVKSTLVHCNYQSRLTRFLGIDRSINLRFDSYNRDGYKNKVTIFDPAKWRGKQVERFKYDKLGRKTESVARQGSTLKKTVYHYDDSVRRVETVETIRLGRKSISRKYLSVFDPRGAQIEAIYVDDRGGDAKAFYKYDYDSEARTRVIRTLNESGFVYHKLVLDYDAAGRLAKRSAFSEKALYEIRIFHFGPEGYKEEVLSYGVAESLERRTVYTFDQFGNLTDVICYAASGELLGRTSHQYFFDDLGNWLERVSRSWDTRTGQFGDTSTQRRSIRYR